MPGFLSPVESIVFRYAADALRDPKAWGMNAKERHEGIRWRLQRMKELGIIDEFGSSNLNPGVRWEIIASPFGGLRTAFNTHEVEVWLDGV